MLSLLHARYRDEVRQPQMALSCLDYARPADRARLVQLLRYTYPSLLRWALLPAQSPEHAGNLQQALQVISHLLEAVATSGGALSRGGCGFVHQRVEFLFKQLVGKPTPLTSSFHFPL